MAEEPSNWANATQPACPFCGDERSVERQGHELYCNCCGKKWLAFNRSDRRFLKVLRIKSDEP